MKFSKTLLLILLLILILGAVIFIQLFSNYTSNKTDLKITPSSQPLELLNNQDLTQINISSTNIGSDPILVGQPIIINFSGPISMDSLKIEVFPKEELRYGLDSFSKELTIETTSGIWKYNSSYILDITGQTLDKTYKYTFQTKPYSGI